MHVVRKKERYHPLRPDDEVRLAGVDGWCLLVPKGGKGGFWGKKLGPKAVGCKVEGRSRLKARKQGGKLKGNPARSDQ